MSDAGLLAAVGKITKGIFLNFLGGFSSKFGALSKSESFPVD